MPHEGHVLIPFMLGSLQLSSYVLILDEVGLSEGNADGSSSYTACNGRLGSKDLMELSQ